MRKNLTLYIRGIKADLDSKALILMNYTQEDLQNPTIVKNSYSQQITLKGTDANNKIFNEYFRSDHKTVSGSFNSLEKTPFIIYNEMGEILEQGYCKLESVEKKGGDISYKVSLYGGLGGFLYGLMYDSDGNKKTLADLTYTSGGNSHEFDFAISKDAVAEAWQVLQGESGAAKWSHINFAPCYNGLPGGGFASDKAFCPTACYGVTSSVTDGGTTYRSRHSNVLVKLTDKHDEWAVGDLRSYLQRPVIKFKSIIDAICDSSQNGGYTVELDSSFFNNSNDYYKSSWLTLPRLDSIQMPITSGNGSGHIGMGTNTPVTGSTTTNVSVGSGSKSMNVLYDVSVSVYPTLTMGSGVSNNNRILNTQWLDVSLTECRRCVVVYQLLGYNANGELVAGSDVVAATTKVQKTSSAQNKYTDYTSTKTWLTKYNNAVSQMSPYYPTWGSIQDNASTSMVLGTKFKDGVLVDANNSALPVTLTLKGYGLSTLVLRTTVLAVNESGLQSTPNSFTYQSWAYAYSYDGTSASDPQYLEGLSHSPGDLYYSWQSEGVQVRSFAPITKQILLGGTDTPADYLLSYCKMFGLCLLFDNASKKVSIVTRNKLYKPTGSAKTIDLQQRVDKSSISVIPYVLDSRWYEFGSPYVGGAWADYYKEVKGIQYGTQRVNTGFSFNADHKEVLDGNSIKGACEVLEQSKYFLNITQDGKICPAVFLDGGKYTLWDDDGNNKDLDVEIPNASATLDYINTTYKGYDYPFYAKLQFHDKDNKALDGSNVLVFYVGSGYPLEYTRFCVTDDSFLMTSLNEGTPCWLLGQQAVDSGHCISSALKYPCFRRYIPNGSDYSVMDLSLDLGTPLEVSEPVISFPSPDTTNIYSKGWKKYIEDRYDVDTRIMTCKVDLRGLGEQIGQNLMRNFYWFDNSYWVLNKIKNYSLTTDDLVECEFIKVKDTSNYYNGQTY